jgi:hypothetical protein
MRIETDRATAEAYFDAGGTIYGQSPSYSLAGPAITNRHGDTLAKAIDHLENRMGVSCGRILLIDTEEDNAANPLRGYNPRTGRIDPPPVID